MFNFSTVILKSWNGKRRIFFPAGAQQYNHCSESHRRTCLQILYTALAQIKRSCWSKSVLAKEHESGVQIVMLSQQRFHKEAYPKASFVDSRDSSLTSFMDRSLWKREVMLTSKPRHLIMRMENTQQLVQFAGKWRGPTLMAFKRPMTAIYPLDACPKWLCKHRTSKCADKSLVITGAKWLKTSAPTSPK